MNICFTKHPTIQFLLILKNNIPDDAYVKLTDKLYLSYYDTKWKKKITKHTLYQMNI